MHFSLNSHMLCAPIILTYKPEKKAIKTQLTNHLKNPHKATTLRTSPELPPGSQTSSKGAWLDSQDQQVAKEGLLLLSPGSFSRREAPGRVHSCAANSLTLPRAHMWHTQDRALVPLLPKDSDTNHSMLMPRSSFCCSLHSCQANDGLFSEQAPSSAAAAAAAKPCHSTSSSTGPCQVLWLPALLQELFFCSASLPHHVLHLTGSQSCHRKVRRAFGQFCNAVGVQHPGVPCPGHRGHPSLLLPGRAPSSPAGGFGPLPGQSLSMAVRPLWPSLERQTGNLQCKRFRQIGKKRVSFTLNNQYEVHVHPRLLLFATSYRSSAFRPQMNFRSVESLFTSAGFGSGPS